jgi:hypothetical protein
MSSHRPPWLSPQFSAARRRDARPHPPGDLLRTTARGRRRVRCLAAGFFEFRRCRCLDLWLGMVRDDPVSFSNGLPSGPGIGRLALWIRSVLLRLLSGLAAGCYVGGLGSRVRAQVSITAQWRLAKKHSRLQHCHNNTGASCKGQHSVS